MPLASPRFWFAAIGSFAGAALLLAAGVLLGFYALGRWINDISGPAIILSLFLIVAGVTLPVLIGPRIENQSPLTAGAIVGLCAAPVGSFVAVFLFFALAGA